ncbi:site-specific integrase [Rhodococcus sp. IEGM 1379]|uniref:tyrosine-type recombinase/integrase n=1 Tax=Rhodococcus sp. IEGM 1379 TaxID=3047086 RepID=UPI0024B64911|nr:site-specific integrase [Rhodococcus sp. IEGM 1379]MDI9917852.1 tyrosine-type recombinase/integrase [Rhodococcus sp. IEGM 1379]
MTLPKRNRRAGVEDLWWKTVKVDNKETKVESKLHGKGKRWRARYVDDDSHERTQRFDRKVDAQNWLNNIVTSQVTGTYIDPARGQITFRSFYAEWAPRQVWVHNTRREMDRIDRTVPFGDVAMSDLRASHFETWVKKMQDQPLAPTTIKSRMMNVRAILKAAIRDKALASDPSQGVKLPRTRRAEAAMVIPTSEQVGQLVTSAEDRFTLFVALCAFAGLRSGEASALQVGDFDFLRRDIEVQRQSQRIRSGVVEIRPPKYGSERTISAPKELIEMAAEHIRLFVPGGDPRRWMFPGLKDNPMETNMVGTRWRKAKKAAEITDLKMHSLRHYFASGLIAAGCDVVTVQRALGHSSASVTLDTYSHLWPKAEDRTRKAASGLLGEALGSTAYPLRTEGPS